MHRKTEIIAKFTKHT